MFKGSQKIRQVDIMILEGDVDISLLRISKVQVSRETVLFASLSIF